MRPVAVWTLVQMASERGESYVPRMTVYVANIYVRILRGHFGQDSAGAVLYIKSLRRQANGQRDRKDFQKPLNINPSIVHVIITPKSLASLKVYMD